MGLPLDLEFRTKGQLAIDLCADACADGLRFDFICGDEVYGSCTQLRQFLESHGQAYVLRVASTFMLTLAAEEDFEFGKGCFGLDQCQARLLYRDRPPHRAGNGRPGDLRHHRRTRARPHRYPGSAAPRARPAAARRARDDPADRPGDRTSPRRPPQPVMPARPCRSLAGLATPPPGPLPVVSSAHPARPRKCPGQLAIGGRRAGGAIRPVCLAFRLPRCALSSVDGRSVVKFS
jgi:DDE superfamily endonuclease